VIKISVKGLIVAGHNPYAGGLKDNEDSAKLYKGQV